ncbi:MAG: selenide, water dikinase SelD [Bacteroidetes bacterium]|nr:selenide, water dikinase SelD [Bacteroidota bacterium]MBS1540552.1 selenide, water dikinase SelD [Bacteroidota bacterium]
MDIKLTQYSHGAGCGCKISPAVLDTILHSDIPKQKFPSLLVGNESKDDAAVYDIGDGTCIISTTDFFMPIVDDPFTFGAIASVNAISDVYAMGGEPFMAIAILGWPINKVVPEVAKLVLEGSRKVCADAGIPLAGGHSIDCPEPVFGLAVSGKMKKENLKRNDTAKEGSLLYLTKKLGIGIITTAQKKGIVKEEHLQQAIDTMLTLNKPGAQFGKLNYISAMTDVTGFGLLGHLCEMCEGSGLSAEIEFAKVPRFDFLQEYLQQKSTPGGTQRNWDSYGHKIGTISDEQRAVLSDPQTSGGLLVAVDTDKKNEFELFSKSLGLQLQSFGKLIKKTDHVVNVLAP